MVKKQKNFRLPDITLQKIEALKTQTGLTEVQIIIMAIDSLTEREARKRQAAELARPAVRRRERKG